MHRIMRVAAIYDIHGNLPALEAVLAAIAREDVDRIVVGGDVVPGPMPGEALARLREQNVPVEFIHGNGESAVLAEAGGEHAGHVPEDVRALMRWSADRLGEEGLRLLASWPATLRYEVPGLGAVLFCHATPRNDTEIFTRDTPADRLLPIFADADAAVVVCGHTHMQFDRSVGGVRVVNAGSVGMPFGEPGAHWLLLGPGIALRRTPYDLERAAKRIRATSYPQAEEFAVGNVLDAPTEEAMLEAFGRSALR